jgi:N-acetylmuramoyl-L-alanine amidase
MAQTGHTVEIASNPIVDLATLKVRHRVLRKNRLPAILVECGFLTNPAEAARVCDSHSRERLARAIADAIVRYN